MTSTSTDSPPWGTYSPHGSERLILLVRQFGLAHGPIKRFISRVWLARRGGRPVDIRYHDIRYRLYPQENTVDLKILFGSRYRDREELEALTDIVRDGGTFVDIGANTGYYTLTAAAAGAGRILAIEPFPPTFERLEFNIRSNGFTDRVHTAQVALGDRNGEAVLYVPEAGDIGSSRISDKVIQGQPVTVPMRPLAELLEEQSLDQIDALKIDVEGMEDTVLFPFFENTEPCHWPGHVIIEHISACDWRRDIIAWMKENGYRESGKTRSNTILKRQQSHHDVTKKTAPHPVPPGLTGSP